MCIYLNIKINRIEIAIEVENKTIEGNKIQKKLGVVSSCGSSTYFCSFGFYILVLFLFT